MQELRLVAVSEDGTYLVLASTGRGTRFMLPVDDRLRAAVRGQFSRLGQYEIEVENPLRPKEIQARIRSGETAETIAEVSGIPIERVRWFESPVLQEREYVAQQAQRASVRRQGEAAPGPALGDLVADRIGAHQLETGDAVWDSWKREDGTWHLKLAFRVMGEERVAHWVYEPRRRSVTPADEEAVRFSSQEPEEPLDLGPGSANVTPFVPRRQGPAADPAPSRPEPSAPARPEPSPRPEPSAAPPERPDEPTPAAARESTPAAERPAADSSDAPERPAAGERPAGNGRVSLTPDHLRPSAPEPETAPAQPAQIGTAEPAPPESTPAAEPAETTDPADQPAAGHPAAGRQPAASTGEPATAQRSAASGGGRGERQEPRRRQEPPVSAAAAGASSGASQPARRKGRNRRASVPSWDEIMFGAKKPD